MWMLPLYLHVNQKSDNDDDDVSKQQRPWSDCLDAELGPLLSILRAEGKTVASQMVVLPQTKSPHHEGIMKITTFLSVNNENLGAIASMSNGT